MNVTRRSSGVRAGGLSATRPTNSLPSRKSASSLVVRSRAANRRSDANARSAAASARSGLERWLSQEGDRARSPNGDVELQAGERPAKAADDLDRLTHEPALLKGVPQARLF
ncbi:MAG: hypothetical protein BGO98_02000 [Myxococcales bacterium 68-20]|nr:MAG: hypothetical protein BGO98_02000 [Myxococcales bacterium 68-20]